MDDNIAGVAGSFRDPSGSLFRRGLTLYRQVNTSYRPDYDLLMDSGLYGALIKAGLLISHDEVSVDGVEPGRAYKIIRPEIVPFISYPYEWSFSQLRAAALATLKVQKLAFEYGMSLKDASAYNVQFVKGKPIFIDTLSFEKYRKGKPWTPYRQYCQHFLAPLALSCYKDVRLSQLSRIHMDGVPLDLASALLPLRTRFILPLLMHIHLHAGSQKLYAGRTGGIDNTVMTRLAFMGIVDNLYAAVNGLKADRRTSEWSGYYDNTNYTSAGFEDKKSVVSGYLDEIRPKTVWDFGANAGIFSRIAAGKGASVISFDIDHSAVEKNYSECVSSGESNILPLLLDITNPSPGIGWENSERMTLAERGPADTVMALALIHHLAITNNLPLVRIAEFFSNICGSLIIEFVPKEDSQVIRLLSVRDDVFPDYDKQAFERDFSRYFSIQRSVAISGSKRVLYLMKKRAHSS